MRKDWKHFADLDELCSQPIEFAALTELLPHINELFQQILGKLEEEEIDMAANTSFAYWHVATKAPKDLPEAARQQAALKEIRRHYVGEGCSIEKAVLALREAMACRKVCFTLWKVVSRSLRVPQPSTFHMKGIQD